MRLTTLDILTCPYCGGRLSLVDMLPHQRDAAEIRDGILGCHCCIFPVVDGIPILHLQTPAIAVRDHVQAGRFDLARRAMFGLDDEARAEAFDAVAASPTATFRETVDALGPDFEGGYFLYRFSDPTFVVADAVVRAVAGAALAAKGSGQTVSRVIDICGGSGHLTRALMDLSSEPPILADLFFAKVWLARRFTAPGCEPVCCDGNSPMPFRKGAFSFAMCTDAFMYIWTKRQFVADMIRLVDARPRWTAAGGDAGRDGGIGTVLIGHAHNERTWSPSHGQPLPPEGYAELFDTIEPRLFGEASLFGDVVNGGPLDLSRRESPEVLDTDPALTIIASTHPDVFAQHPLTNPVTPRGEFRLNPLYAVEPDGDKMRLRLQFPSEEYEQEYGACRHYLPDALTLERPVLEKLALGGPLTGDLIDLARRRILVDLPARYY